MEREEFRAALAPLEVQLVRMQAWVKRAGARVLLLVEGRDAAGKGKAIQRLTAPLNPRGCRVVALERPSDRERTQWYFQRYVAHLPAAGEVVVFDRSWYNRAGLEVVNGFCTADEHEDFLRAAPDLERLLVRAGLHLRKVYFSIGREEQARRLEKRKHGPRAAWKLTPLDLVAQERWDDYTRAEERMFARTATPDAPWTVVQADDKRRAQLDAIRWLLSTLDYPGREDALLAVDPGRVTTLRGGS